MLKSFLSKYHIIIVNLLQISTFQAFCEDSLVNSSKRHYHRQNGGNNKAIKNPHLFRWRYRIGLNTIKTGGYVMKKGINIWSFPAGMKIADCIRMAKDAGFDGIELALNESGELSLESSDNEILGYKKIAENEGIEISSLATGLYWSYSLTSNSTETREKAEKIVKKQLDAAALLGVDTILVVSGAVGVDFIPGSETVEYDVAYERSLKAISKLSLYAAEKKVYIGIENVWNKFLLSPLEMRDFIDKAASGKDNSENDISTKDNSGKNDPGKNNSGKDILGKDILGKDSARGDSNGYVGAFFDVGNVIYSGYPEHWIKILGSRIKKVHFKDYRRDAGGLYGFVDLLAGDVDYKKVMDELKKAGYNNYVVAEMIPGYKLYPEQIVYNTSKSMDKILGR